MGTAGPTFNLISSENVEGTTVYNPSGDKIGEIDHLMIDKVSGNVRYAVMSFGDRAREGYITNVTEDQLKDAPEFSDDSWSDRDWETRWHRHFATKPYWEQGAAAQPHNPMNPPRSI